MLQILLRVVVAGILGYVIGLTNRYAYRNVAGRLFCIISMGACLVTITSMEFFKLLEMPWISDPGRLAAQIVSALGFLGTGLIWISDDNHIRGLSAGASLWFTAILGIMVGAGLHAIGVIATIFLIIIYFLSDIVARRKHEKLLVKEKNKTGV
jgi:putative Mg2+ transporter-C (MgtC) family protein